jgi:DNA-binding NtrC family response regulator
MSDAARPPAILLVDDEPDIAVAYSMFLRRAGFATHGASSLAAAREALASTAVEVILLDLDLPDGNGLDWIGELRESRPEVALIVITGTGDVPVAVEAMRRGADHFLTKPVSLPDLEVFLRKSLEVGRMRRKALGQQRLSSRSEPFWGRGPAMAQVRELAEIAAGDGAPALLEGETGTGKGVIARWIHDHSARGGSAFVEVNCSSLRGDLLASELFGHARGAFTSALENRPGLLDVAHDSTLFLDEIGDMDLSTQSQFLKVIEEKRYRRIGEVKERFSEFRLLCATHRSLPEMVEAGTFRKDLFFRIQVFPIRIPPLRDRPEDIGGLVSHLLGALGAPGTPVSASAMDALLAYGWPGNVRELRNVLERALLLSRRSEIHAEHLPGLERPGPLANRAHPRHEERMEIEEAMRLFEGDKALAAEHLGISRATLYRRLKALGLDR